MAAVEFRKVDIIFGDEVEAALGLLDEGQGREAILEKTGCVIGVAGASLAVERAETCVLMGLSGSGKSTLLRSVNGLNKVTRGEVLVEHEGRTVDVTRCGGAELRELRMRRISMVFQQFALLPWRTVAENVGFGLELRGLERAERERIVADKLKLVGLDRWKDKYANELSGGMQQRVGLARAFATDADILLMDEPFSALDPLIRTHLQDELLELQHKLKKTIVFVSHDLDEALKLGTHIAIMESGRIVQYGEPEAIVLAPANEYVAEFVAHMNPINVLRGASLMTPAEDIRREGEELCLDRVGNARLRLGENGRPEAITVGGRPGRLVEWGDGVDLDGLAATDVVAAHPDILMRQAIEIRQRTGTPVVLVDGGKLVGLVGDEEIFRGILRQTSLGERKARADESEAGDEQGAARAQAAIS